MKNKKFFICHHCKNLIDVIQDGGMPMICCGEPMEELQPNTVDAATEKHIPVVSINGRLVHAKIGSVPHPMTEEHHISFLYLKTENGGQHRMLPVGTDAAAMFAVLEDNPLEVYAYCNLHGLWKAAVPCDCGCEHDEENDTEEVTCSSEFSEGCK